MDRARLEEKLEIQKARLNNCAELEGLVVVIDVVRAFTTAAYAFAAGAEKILLVGDVEEAFRLHRLLPWALLAGEQNGGIGIEGFHLGNSPLEMSKAHLKGKTLILRTSSGTQGVVRSRQATKMLVSSFVVAEATLQRIRFLTPQKLGFVITGTKRGGSEDLALADYLESRLCQAGPVAVEPYLERVKFSPTGVAFSSGMYSYLPVQDLEACCQSDRFCFAMEVFAEDGLLALYPVNSQGMKLNLG